MMTFEDEEVCFYLMNARLAMFKIILPYEAVRDLLTTSGEVEPLTDDKLRAWLAAPGLRIFTLFHYRAQVVDTSTDHDDYRVSVIPISKASVLYKAALADRQASLAAQDRETREVSFVRGVRFIFGPGEINDPDCRDSAGESASH